MGSRAYYWSKDLTIEPRVMSIPYNPLVAFVDVDEYVDMPNFLAKHAHPTVIYTFQPDQVAKVANNYSYTFDKDNNVVYAVTGGGGYTHPVWNYSTDHVVVSNTIFGIPYRRVCYAVERRNTAPDHEIILLVPIGTWFGLGAILHKMWIEGRDLERLKPATPEGFLRMQISSLEGVKVSTGRVGYYNSATIPVVTDDTIATIARTNAYDLTMAPVLSFVDGDRQAAAALLDFHRSANGGEKRPVVCPVPQAVRRYQFDPRNFDPKAKPSMVAFMSPMINDAFVPDQTVGNEVQCVEGRIENVKPKELPLTPFLVNTMKEFLELLIPDEQAQLLDPVEYDVVLERQHRPTQRRILANSECGKAKRIISMFMKKEPYSNVKDPRAISTINGVDKREYSRYMYSFECIMKKQPWYAFAKTPIDIANRVSQLCEECISHTTNSDFKRFDGHGSNLMRELEKMALVRAFRVTYHAEILELHKGQYNLKAYAALGTMYETDYTRASGSPETSLFNTLVNAFTAYLAKRMSKDMHGVHICPTEAYAALGIYGGDDGLTADLDANIYKRAASSIGQELDVEPIRRGHGGVKFLARVYSPHVWFGDNTSCCDIPRQVGKFHMSVRMPVTITPIMKLLEKVRSYVLSDENTPIIGDLCRRVIEINGEIAKDEKLSQLSTWLAQYDKKVQYPNAKASWMMSYCEHALPDFDYKRFVVWLASCSSVDDILRAPMFQAPTPAKSDVPVAIDGMVLPHGTKIPAKPSRGKSNSTNSQTKTTTINPVQTSVSANASTTTTQRQVSGGIASPGNNAKPSTPLTSSTLPAPNAVNTGQATGIRSGVTAALLGAQTGTGIQPGIPTNSTWGPGVPTGKSAGVVVRGGGGPTLDGKHGSGKQSGGGGVRPRTPTDLVDPHDMTDKYYKYSDPVYSELADYYDAIDCETERRKPSIQLRWKKK